MSIYKKHAVALIDIRADKSIISALGDYAEQVLLLPPCPSLPTPVSAHADMLLWSYESVVFTFEEYLETARGVFDALRDIGYDIRTIAAPPADRYPADIPLNCATLGDVIIANTRFCAPEIVRLAEQSSLRLIHTNQGYAKCSVCIVSDNAIITANKAIHTSAVAAGIDSLLVSEGNVRLDGYDTGFIGGATGSDTQNVYFCGDVDTHADADRIREFCVLHGRGVVSLSRDPLYDVGTILFFDRL